MTVLTINYKVVRSCETVFYDGSLWAHCSETLISSKAYFGWFKVNLTAKTIKIKLCLLWIDVIILKWIHHDEN